MPLTFSEIFSGAGWKGSSWEVVDDEKLAELIARVAMGQSRYVRRVLTELNVVPQKGFGTALDGAIKRLTAENQRGC